MEGDAKGEMEVAAVAIGSGAAVIGGCSARRAAITHRWSRAESEERTGTQR